MLIATALVLMMTPALGLFYAGLVRSKNTLNTFMMSSARSPWPMVMWALVGYSLAFAKGRRIHRRTRPRPHARRGLRPARRDGDPATHCSSPSRQRSASSPSRWSRAQSSSGCASAPSWSSRALWSVLVYAVLAHWSFGGGWLQAHGTLDFAGGVPVEMGSGFSALAAALVVGARKDYGRQALLPHNAVYVLLGAGLLWFGWFGFNGGSGFSTGHSSVLAFTNTLLTPACTLVVWFVLDLLRGRRVTAIGAATAIIVGCVAITPAGGYISPGWAMVLGALAALPSYAIIVWRPRTRVDETLDVLAAHGTAGLTGILFIGFVAQLAWNGKANGLLYGNAAQLGHQAIAALAGPAYAFAATFLLLRLIGVFMPLRATEHEEALGMDIVQHGEEAYATGEGAILLSTEAALEDAIPVAQP